MLAKMLVVLVIVTATMGERGDDTRQEEEVLVWGAPVILQEVEVEGKGFKLLGAGMVAGELSPDVEDDEELELPAVGEEHITLAQVVAAAVEGRRVRLPNTWEERPSVRFPYYDHRGRGAGLYGYGGQELYQYTTFNAIEGFY